MNEFKRNIAQKVKQSRKKMNMTQAELAEKAGFAAHQTVSQIEKGQREIKAWELAAVARALHTDILQLMKKEISTSDYVLWRSEPKERKAEKEAEFLQKCRYYSELENLCGLSNSRPLPCFEVNSDSVSYSNVKKIADETLKMFDLGARPAKSLDEVLQDDYGVKIWYMDLGENGSGACTKNEGFGEAILINKSESPWRMNFSLAHELFHLLVWNSFSPEEMPMNLWDKLEKLADKFAANLLLPESLLQSEFEERVKENKIYFIDLIFMARDFDVSTQALIYRLANLQLLDWDIGQEILENEEFRRLDRSSMPQYWKQRRYLPSLPERYVYLAFEAYQKDKISRSRMAQLLNTSLVDLSNFLLEYGLDELENYQTQVRTS